MANLSKIEIRQQWPIKCSLITRYNKKSRTEAHNIKNQNASRLTRTLIVQESLNDPEKLNSTIVLNLVDKSLNN